MSGKKISVLMFAGLVALLTLSFPNSALVSPDRGTSTGEKKDRGKGSDRGYLGVSIQEIGRNLREAFDIPRDVDGVLITRVEEDSPAEDAGLEDRDVIRSVNGQEIGEADDLTRVIRDAGAGSEVTLSIWRDGKVMEVRAKLDSPPKGRGFAFGWSGDDEDREPRMFHFPMSGDHGGPMVFNLSRRGYLGVELQELNEEIAPFFSATRGALIWSVNEDSPAEKAGLKAGDVIIEIEGKPVRTVEDAMDILSDYDPSETVAVTVLRKGSQQTVKVELQENSDTGIHRFVQRFRTEPRGSKEDMDRSMERLRRRMEQLQERMSRLKKDLDEMSD